MKKEKDFFYFISQGKFLICDLDCCAKSSRTIDMPFFELANNEKLLDKLHLYFMQGNYGVRYTYESRAKWFAGYLSAFGNDNLQYEKSIKNPNVRLLIEDEKTLAEIKTLIN